MFVCTRARLALRKSSKKESVGSGGFGVAQGIHMKKNHRHPPSGTQCSRARHIVRCRSPKSCKSWYGHNVSRREENVGARLCCAVLCCVVCCGVEGDTFIAPAQMYRKLFEICRSSDQPANAGSALLRLGPAVGVRDNVWNLSDGWINVCIAMDKQIHSSAPKKQMVGGF